MDKLRILVCGGRHFEDYALLNNILNTLAFIILLIPTSIHNLYNTYIKNEEELCYTKTIITTKIPNKKLLIPYKHSNSYTKRYFIRFTYNT